MTVNFHCYVAVTASKSPGLIITMVYSLYVFHALTGLAVALLLYLLEFWTKSQGVSATWDMLFSQERKKRTRKTSLWLLIHLLGNGIYHFHLYLIGQASHMVKADNSGWASVIPSEEDGGV